MKKTCPVCAAPGEDLVFTFECTNPECQNFVPGAAQDQKQKTAPQKSESEEGESELDEYCSDWAAWSD